MIWALAYVAIACLCWGALIAVDDGSDAGAAFLGALVWPFTALLLVGFAIGERFK